MCHHVQYTYSCTHTIRAVRPCLLRCYLGNAAQEYTRRSSLSSQVQQKLEAGRGGAGADGTGDGDGGIKRIVRVGCCENCEKLDQEVQATTLPMCREGKYSGHKADAGIVRSGEEPCEGGRARRRKERLEMVTRRLSDVLKWIGW